MKFYEEHKDLFKDVVFLVEATSYEHNSLWIQYSTEYLTLPFAPKENEKFPSSRVNWEQEFKGAMVEIGWLNTGLLKKHPICVDVSYAKINGKRILFYYGCSQLVDHQMIEDWLKHFTKSIRWDNGVRWARCDASNFHLCLDALVSFYSIVKGDRYE